MIDFKAFPEIIDKSAWTLAVQKILKDQPLLSLQWNTSDKLHINPYYKKSDFQGVIESPMALDTCKLRQEFVIKHGYTKDLNRVILQALEHGLESLGLTWMTPPNQSDFEEVMNGIHGTMIHLHIKTQTYDDWVLMMDILEKIQLPNTKISDFQGSIICLKDELKIFNYIINNQTFKLYPKLRFWQVSGENLESLLIHGHQILSNALEHGISLDNVTARIQFIVPINTVLIESIAHIKTLRLIWAFIIEAYKPQHKCNNITYIITQNETQYYNPHEPLVYNNILKQTTQAMASIMGTADECQIESFDTTQTLDPNFTQRISRNIIHLLREESFLNQNKDPLKGAYAVEALIQKTSEQIWKNILPHLQ